MTDHDNSLTLPSGLRVRCRVIGALLMREMVTRYGRENIGFLWLVIEPLILTTGVMIVWSLMKHESHAVSLIAFVLTGYMPLTLWRHISGQLVSCIKQTLPLFYHRQVRPLDTLFARGLMELAGTTFALIVVYTALRLTNLIEPYADLEYVFAGWFYMAWFSFAIGLILAAGSQIFDFVEKLVAPFQYLTLPISGTFFMVAWLPSSAQQLALYVPTVHCFELFRAGMLGESIETTFDVSYLTMCCILLTALGLLLVQQASKHLEFE